MTNDAPWFVYIVECQNGYFYTGITNDVTKRIDTHNSGDGAKALRAFGLPVKLVYCEKQGLHESALKREAQIKKMTRAEKLSLISKTS